MAPLSNPVVSVRMTTKERTLLELAAQQAHTNLSEFVRRKALEAAEIDVLRYREVEIPAADWDRFESWAASPGRPIPVLRDLAAVRPAWRD